MYGDRISYLREKANLTQDQLAKKIGITRAALSHYEKNRREPDFETIEKIARFFDVSLDYLLGRTDDPTPKVSNLDEPGLKSLEMELLQMIREKNLTTEQLEELQKLATHLLHMDPTTEQLKEMQKFADFLLHKKDQEGK